MPPEDRQSWFRDAAYGMFIHWGLYSVPAGIWQGSEVAGTGEWIMNHARIPRTDYEKLAGAFAPDQFSAEAWVELAVRAGMRYLVFTAKHHDGFAMFHSRCSRYNVVDATPFGRDVVGELANACARAGIPFCLYYSQTLDWHHPDGSGNDWERSGPNRRSFSRYFAEKAMPQVRELLTSYGPISMLWLDTPGEISRQQSSDLAELIHECQPDCLISGRIGNDVGDYVEVGDNFMPYDVLTPRWELPATTNDTWGYKAGDRTWKPPKEILRTLAKAAARGGNYLLNVGPDSRGIIPDECARILRLVGQWLARNRDAIFGTVPRPRVPYEIAWGEITSRPGKLYLIVIDRVPLGFITLHGLTNRISRVFRMSDGSLLPFEKRFEESSNHDYTWIRGIPPDIPGDLAEIIVVEHEGQQPIVRFEY